MPQETTPQINVYARTDIGMVRAGNEDTFLVLNLNTADTWTPATIEGEPPETLVSFTQGQYGSVLAVSDGMGGALAGEVASRMAVDGVRDRMLHFQANAAFAPFPFHERLRLAVEQANIHINNESLGNADYAGMGATFTAAGIHGGSLVVAQIGDSRCYLIRGGRIHLVTHDQSLVWQLVEAGHITEEEAETHQYKNVILQALGAQPRVNVVVDRARLCEGDVVLLCSDGLSGRVRADEMLSIVSEATSLREACDRLIAFAHERGGDDNITVVLARIEGGVLPPPGELDNERIERDPDLPYDVDFDPFSTDPGTTLPLGSQRVTQPLSNVEANGEAPAVAAQTSKLRGAGAKTARLELGDDPLLDGEEDDPLDQSSETTAELKPPPDVFTITTVGMPAITAALPHPPKPASTGPPPPASFSKPLERQKPARIRRTALGLLAAIAVLGTISIVIWNIQSQRSRAANGPPASASPPASEPAQPPPPVQAIPIPTSLLETRIQDLSARLEKMDLVIEQLDSDKREAARVRGSSARAKLQEAGRVLAESSLQAETLCNEAEGVLNEIDRDFLRADPTKPDADGSASG
jgi:serine/threonine protein phosphatase PrpC